MQNSIKQAVLLPQSAYIKERPLSLSVAPVKCIDHQCKPREGISVSTFFFVFVFFCCLFYVFIITVIQIFLFVLSLEDELSMRYKVLFSHILRWTN